jgi:hypothetical protein
LILILLLILLLILIAPTLDQDQDQDQDQEQEYLRFASPFPDECRGALDLGWEAFVHRTIERGIL